MRAFLKYIRIGIAILGGALFSSNTSGGELSFPNVDLTPVGAEMAGNADGSIPRWIGGDDNRKEFGPKLIKEKPLFTINKTNIEDYRTQLPNGLSGLVDHYPTTMTIPVYKSYRPVYLYPWIYEAIEKNSKSAKLTDGGDSITDTYSGIPFPLAKTGYEVLWNHILAYRGVSVDVGSSEVVVHENRRARVVKNRVKYAIEYYNKDRKKSGLDQMYAYYLSSVTYPPKLSGGGLLVHERVNPSRIPRQAWGYMAGQRRVIRIPSVDYDAPMPRSGGIRFADEIDIYNGSIDRYSWRLVGKKELIVPYNNELLYDEIKKDDVLSDKLYQQYHPDPQYLRYEKHRVWVVEGTLKEGASHPYKKRVLYMDEDTWLVVVAENYNKKNALWRVSASYVRLYHELPTAFKVVDVFHDLVEKSYFAQSIDPKREITTLSVMPAKQTFKPSALRRMGRR
ncbi:hypothetical protein A9Q99_22600 [Gammaproteobacteria bacterium 45_16_T64]|nr:hypothetical protein A9Q99_22600 [Gammaproteobacteria bacterium 45_16_T64]